jgi:8-amino-7-oxononanoate synthase
MIDFTSSLYLGFRHPSRSLAPWAQLTTGAPATLGVPRMAHWVAGELAGLQGCDDATLARSTVHAFIDLIPMIATEGSAVLIDANTYPVGRWGAERAACRGIPARSFAHHDAAAMRAAMRSRAVAGRRPVIVTDSICPGCGGLAPLSDYLEAVQAGDGLVVIDDTQALGVLGRDPAAAAPYGWGGGGSLRHAGIRSSCVVVVASLAKGLGVPVAVVSAPSRLIRLFENSSETRAHCSPPSLADIHAAARALDMNRRFGDGLRRKLWILVARFRRSVADAGLPVAGDAFPVQTLFLAGHEASRLHRCLLAHGIHAVLQAGGCRTGSALSFVITAAHTPADIDWAAGVLATYWRYHRTLRRHPWPAKTRRTCGATLAATGAHGR